MNRCKYRHVFLLLLLAWPPVALSVTYPSTVGPAGAPYDSYAYKPYGAWVSAVFGSEYGGRGQRGAADAGTRWDGTGSTQANASAGPVPYVQVQSSGGPEGNAESYVVYQVTSATNPLGTSVPVTMTWNSQIPIVLGSASGAWARVRGENCSLDLFCSPATDFYFDTPSLSTSGPTAQMGSSYSGGTNPPYDPTRTETVRLVKNVGVDLAVGDMFGIILHGHSIGSFEPNTVSSVYSSYQLSAPAGFDVSPLLPAAVPVPPAMWLLLSGIAGVAFLVRQSPRPGATSA